MKNVKDQNFFNFVEALTKGFTVVQFMLNNIKISTTQKNRMSVHACTSPPSPLPYSC